jgi:hypothetical protein
MSAEERQLLRLMRSLESGHRASLLAFARFLASGQAGAPAVPATGEVPALVSRQPEQEPQPEARPDEETVIAAIKRLRRVYPMLDAGEMLQETSALMASHVMQGRPAAAVIDELEALFAARYAARTSQPS